MVVDSTNLIAETDETDNEFQTRLTWLPSSAATPVPLTARLPDLVPYRPPGWGAPIIATSYPGETTDGPLSADVQTFVMAAARNEGLSSTPEDIWVYVYIDDVLIDMRRTPGLLIDDPATRSRIGGLLDKTPVSPGVHTLKMVVDPNDLVVESDEDNNTFEKRLVWSAGPVPPRPLPTAAPVPTYPAPLSLPNLVPGWRFGWDGPIVVSGKRAPS